LILKIITGGDLINTPSIAILFLVFHKAHITVASLVCSLKESTVLRSFVRKMEPYPNPRLLLYRSKQTLQEGRQRKCHLPSLAHYKLHISYSLSTSCASRPFLSVTTLDKLTRKILILRGIGRNNYSWSGAQTVSLEKTAKVIAKWP